MRIILSIFILVVTLFATPCSLDLSTLDANRTIKLNGPWKLYTDTLLKPSEAQRTASEKTLSIPGYVSQPEKGYLKSGYGAHTIQLTLTGLEVDSHYALHIPEVFSAYKLFWNDSLISQNGTVGTSAKNSQAHWEPKHIHIKAQKSSATLTYHFSNFQYKWGGFMLTPHIGKEEAIEKHHHNLLAIDLVLLGAIGIIALYHLSLFFLHKNDKTPLYFSFIAIVFAIRTMVTGELLITHFWRGVPWELLIKINFLGIALFLPCFSRYLKSLFPEQHRHKSMKAVDILSLLYGSIVLLAPASVHSHFLSPAFHLVLLFGCVSLIVTLVNAMKAKVEFSHYPFWAMVILFLTVVNDILSTQNIIGTIQLAPVGLVTFLFIQAFLISKKFSRAFFAAEKNAKDLEELNQNLEAIVTKRTQDLSIRNRELEEALHEVKTLSGLLPICAHCKKIKDDNGYWERIEEYFEAHADIDFSHGLCPDCAHELYPDLDMSDISE